MRAALLLTLIATSAPVATLTTACNRADAENAVAAAADGDTVTVHSGACVRNSPVVISQGITLLGAGVDATRITSGGFSMTVPSGKSWRVKVAGAWSFGTIPSRILRDFQAKD